nr:MAG TPA: hypothetical protein [Caudoviricetes sp.]
MIYQRIVMIAVTKIALHGRMAPKLVAQTMTIQFLGIDYTLTLCLVFLKMIYLCIMIGM